MKIKKLLKLSVLLIYIIISGINSCNSNSNNDNIDCARIEDALFSFQWHLQNTSQSGGKMGEDANVIPVWNQSICGSGVNIVVVDDGLDINHEDLKDNVVSGKSHNYLTGSSNPSGVNANHGTCVGGLAAGSANSIGVRGAAPFASLWCYNLLQNITTSNETNAMTRNASEIHVSNNSWGPLDYTGLLLDSTSTWRSAIDTGLDSGRNGLGIIYVWACGLQ